MSETIQIPKGWQFKKLEELVQFKKGKKPSNIFSEKKNDSLPYVDIKAFEKNIINFYGKKNDGVVCQKNDVLVVWDGARSGLVGIGINGLVGSTIASLKCSELIFPMYLFYFLKSKYNLINTNPRGDRIPHVKPDLFWNLSIPLPSLQTQKKIVQKLDDILGQLEEKKKQILELIEKRKETISQLSQKTIGGLIINYMKLDNPPENWQLKTIDECTDIKPGFAQGQKNIQDGTIHLRMNNIGKNFQLNFDKVRTINATKDQLKIYRLEKGDVIFNNTNSPELVGKSFLFDDEQLCLYSNHLTRCRVKKDLILPEWLLFYIRGKWLRRDFERTCNKWINQAAVGSDKLKKLQIPIPSLSEQKQILKILFNASEQFEQISNFEKTIKIRDIQNKTLLQNIQSSILDVAFSGKIVQ